MAERAPDIRNLRTIGLIGVGNLGSAMARRLLSRGHSVLLYTRRPQTLADFADARAHIQPSAAELASRSDVVLVVVRTEDQLREVVLDDRVLGSLRPQGGLVLHSTVRPQAAIDIAAAASHYGIDVLEAPISGGPAGAEAGTLNIMVGASAAAFDRHRWVLDELGSLVQLLGPPGAGNTLKLINNSTYVVQLHAVLAAVELAERGLIDPRTAAAALAAGSGDSFALRRLAGSGFSLHLSGMPSAAHVLDLLDKDVRLLGDLFPGSELATLAAEALEGLRRRS
jgi:3-hydroxyisobutyrate dehydrogenase